MHVASSWIVVQSTMHSPSFARHSQPSTSMQPASSASAPQLGSAPVSLVPSLEASLVLSTAVVASSVPVAVIGPDVVAPVVSVPLTDPDDDVSPVALGSVSACVSPPVSVSPSSDVQLAADAAKRAGSVSRSPWFHCRIHAR